MFETYLVGRLTKEPEMRTTPTGKNVCQFDVAHNKKVNGEDRTVFVKVVTWEKTADACEKYLHKGSLVLANGEVSADAYIGKDGKCKGSLRLVAKNIDFLSDWGNKKGEVQPEELTDIDPADIPF